MHGATTCSRLRLGDLEPLSVSSGLVHRNEWIADDIASNELLIGLLLLRTSRVM